MSMALSNSSKITELFDKADSTPDNAFVSLRDITEVTLEIHQDLRTQKRSGKSTLLFKNMETIYITAVKLNRSESGILFPMSRILRRKRLNW